MRAFKILSIATVASLLLSGCISPSLNSDRSPASLPGPQLTQGHIFLEKVNLGNYDERQRVGVFVESSSAPKLKGCVMYLEGLGDSIMNHAPLFDTLNDAGYRVIAFDYLGQGQSDGEMAQMRVNALGDPYPKFLEYEIGEQAKRVWKRYSTWKDPLYGRTCTASKKFVIGWSTGGLAAYKLAYEKWTDGVVLITPGIVPNLCVGEAGNSTVPRCVEKNLTLDQTITLPTLTHAPYNESGDPHVDPIEPKTPMKAKEFVINLVSTAYLQARFWHINPKQKGLVYLSGKEDTYIDRDAIHEILLQNAPSFTVLTREGALHEIDNEIPEISIEMHKRTVEFFDQLGAP